MSDFLRRMSGTSGRRAAQARQATGEAELRAQARDLPPPVPLELGRHGFDIIAEVKRRSPSAGTLNGDASPGGIGARVRAYADAGACAVSVLTEPERFAGSLDDLRSASLASSVPVMRKDFLVDPHQVIETRVAGASGVLLILRLLDDARLLEMLDAAREMGLFVLLEAFDRRDLGRARSVAELGKLSEPSLIGLNCRDLSTLEIDRSRFSRLRDAFPPAIPAVAESGLTEAAHVRQAAAANYRVALIGTALMRAPDAAVRLRELLAAGRQEVSRTCTSE